MTTSFFLEHPIFPWGAFVSAGSARAELAKYSVKPFRQRFGTPPNFRVAVSILVEFFEAFENGASGLEVSRFSHEETKWVSCFGIEFENEWNLVARFDRNNKVPLLENWKRRKRILSSQNGVIDPAFRRVIDILHLRLLLELACLPCRGDVYDLNFVLPKGMEVPLPFPLELYRSETTPGTHKRHRFEVGVASLAMFLDLKRR